MSVGGSNGAGRPPDEPPLGVLLQSASLARRLAPVHCAQSGTGCAWYHGAWPLWRALGLGVSPNVHADFFFQAVGAIPHRPNPRVLVSGAADEGVPTLVAQAFRAAGMEPTLTVLDRCETPLHLVHDQVGRIGCGVETVRSDIRAYRPEEPFDAICTHGFLGYFSPDERLDLARAWRAQLEPGGCVLTVNRLRADAPDGRLGFTQAQCDRFAEAVRERSAAILPGEDPGALLAMARAYTAGFSVYPVRDEADLAAPLRDAGFEVAVRTEALAPRPGGPTGPATPGGALYAFVVATAGPP